MFRWYCDECRTYHWTIANPERHWICEDYQKKLEAKEW